MRSRTSFLMRCLALVLALVLVVSGSNLGIALRAYAAGGETVSVGQLVAENYDELTGAEKELLKSGYLNDGDAVEIGELPEDVVSVDTEKKEITAVTPNGWAIDGKAAILVNGVTEEEVTLESGKGTYSYPGNAFTVKVNYVLTTNKATADQQALLDAIEQLKQGIATLETVKSCSSELSVLELAMDELVDLCDQKYTIPGTPTTITLSESAKAAIKTLDKQMSDNGGALNLSNMIANYEATAKSQYLMNDAVAMKDEVPALLENVKEIVGNLTMLANNSDFMVQLGAATPEQAKQLKNMANICNNLQGKLEAAESADWSAAGKTALLSDSVNYADLDAKLAAVINVSEVELKESLVIATAERKANAAMFNVTVKVVLKAVQDNEVKEYDSVSTTLTLGEGVSAEEIVAAVEADGIVGAALNAWEGVYVDGKFDKTATDLPASLTENVDYIITYSPKSYTVDIEGEGKANYPFGYQLTLPMHGDSEKSYDYYLGSEYYPQGSVITVKDNMTFARDEGKAYETGMLYEILAGNYASADSKASTILTSGALNGDKMLAYRQPSEEELEAMVKLEGNVLTVGEYDSDYKDYKWVPYSYEVDGIVKYFGDAREVTLPADFETVKAYYRLTFVDYTEEMVGDIFGLVEDLAAEAAGQKSVMDKLASFEGQMSQLNKNMLNGLNGVIGGYSTANGGGLNGDPEVNDALVAFFQKTIGELVANCTEGQALRLNNIIKAYKDPNNGGLSYYYQNHAMIRNEIAVLSGYLNEMLDKGDRQAALEKLMAENGYSDKVDTLETLGTKLAEIEADLVPANEAISTGDTEKLVALSKALAMEGEAKVTVYDSPYKELGPVTRNGEKFVTVEVKTVVNGKSNTASVTIHKGEALTQAQVDALKAAVAKNVADAKINTAFFNNDYDEVKLDTLVGVALDKGVKIEYNWTPKEAIVKIAGQADQTVTVNKMTITLPGHPNAAEGWKYEYVIYGETVGSGTYSFEKKLEQLLADGVLEITFTEKNTATEDLEKMVANINADLGFKALSLVAENGKYTGINANLGLNNMMDFIMGLVMKSGYGYIGLNNEGLVYENDKAELELSIQTLINAILKDNTFSDKTIVKLAEDGKGKVVTASMQLGSSAQELNYTDLTFTLNLSSVPEQLTNNVELLKKAFNYVKFNSNNGELDVNVTLPDQVYGAYAAVLIAVGEVDKADVAALNNRIAVEFLYDYIKAILDSEMDLTSINNTLDMLANRRLAQLDKYNHYFDAAVNYYNKWVDVKIGDDSTTIDVKIDGKTAIDKLIAFAGINNPMLDSAIGMIKEHKDGETIDAKINASLTNQGKDYLALIVDAQASGVTNKFEAPSSLAELQNQTKTLAGYSVMMLLNDVEGDLEISGKTVLDLNGKNVTGNIKSTGTLFIIDSSMGTYNAGLVDGAISGNVTIIGGNYTADVKAYMKDGYYQHNGTVRNALYHIVHQKANVLARNSNQYDTINIVLNADVYKDEHVNGYLPNVKALAVDIATDLILNYALSAKLAVDGETLIDLQFNDLVGVLAGEDTAKNLINTLIGCINVGKEGYENNEGFEALVNRIIADLLDFEAVGAALENGTPLATYAVTTAPWKIELDHVEDGDYATVNVGSNKDLEKTVNVALTIQGAESVGKLISELGEIVEEANVRVDIPKPTYSDKTLTVSGAGKASVSVDMADGEYAKMLAVILAYGNDAKRAEVAAAINDGNVDALKPVIDKTSVKELFTALKVMNRNTNFAAMAKAVGVTVDVTSVAELEALYHLPLVAAGKALEKLNITGMDSKFGALYNEDSGYYELTKKDIFRDVEISRRGYTALVELEATELTLKVKLFNCMIGDVNHDNVIDTTDAGLIEQYLAEMNLPVFCFRGADVNGDDVVDTTDAGLMRQYLAEIIREFPAE